MENTTSPPSPENDSLIEKRVLADRPGVKRILNRLAHEVVERNGGSGQIALVGIRRGGFYLAKKIAEIIGNIEKEPPLLGAVDITLYRDDVFIGLPRPVIGPTELPFKLGGRIIVLVDDVVFTGRTVRAALDALMDYGRPKAVQLMALVDRGHRELPISPDYVGMTIETSVRQSVKVCFSADESVDSVILREKCEEQ